LACLDDEGLKEIAELIDYYMGNAALLRQTMLDIGLKVKENPQIGRTKPKSFKTEPPFGPVLGPMGNAALLR
jgi:hypothetical protein